LARSVCLCIRHPLVLQELSHLIAGQTFRPVAGRMEPGNNGLAPAWRLPSASVYVVDSPSRRENTEILISTILERYPRARVLVVAERLDENSTFAFLRLGAKGLLRYSDLESQLIQALQMLIAGGSWIPRHFLFRFIDQTLRSARKPTVRPAGARLSRRESEVLSLLLENLSNKEIAGRLHISSRTAKFHVSNLLAKYGVKRRTDLLMMRSA
jgi:DNA-binding NarL/FixJ family response regulator